MLILIFSAIANYNILHTYDLNKSVILSRVSVVVPITYKRISARPENAGRDFYIRTRAIRDS